MDINPLEAEQAQYQKLEAQFKAAQERNTKLQDQLTALKADTEQTRKEIQLAYVDRHSKRFADVDLTMVFSGLRSPHGLTVYGTTYELASPNRDYVVLVEDWLLKARQAPADGKKDPEVIPGTPLGLVTEDEEVLLTWLTGVRSGGQAKDLTRIAPALRLATIRQLPVALIGRLAEEAKTLHSYLCVRLEVDLGNS